MKQGYLNAFAALHEVLESELEFAQMAALAGAWPEAERLLKRYEQLLRLHIRQEESHWLPLHQDAAENCGQSPKWSADLYLKEHRKLEKMFAALSQDFKEMRTLNQNRELGGQQLLGRLLRWLEACSRFKNLTEHHHEREHQGLFPELERWLGVKRLQQTLALCLDEWAAFEGSLELDQEAVSSAVNNWNIAT